MYELRERNMSDIYIRLTNACFGLWSHVSPRYLASAQWPSVPVQLCHPKVPLCFRRTSKRKLAIVTAAQISICSFTHILLSCLIVDVRICLQCVLCVLPWNGGCVVAATTESNLALMFPAMHEHRTTDAPAQYRCKLAIKRAVGCAAQRAAISLAEPFCNHQQPISTPGITLAHTRDLLLSKFH